MPSHKQKPPNERLVVSSYIKLVRATDSVIARSHRHLIEANLTFSQFAVLEALNHFGPLPQKDIAAKILKSPRNITMVVDNLEKRDLVRRERNSGDRRSFNVQITEAGRKLLAGVLPRHIEARSGKWRYWTPVSLRNWGACAVFSAKGFVNKAACQSVDCAMSHHHEKI
jgi:MarR family 2-MHQ and catechol resistance regulon transcriptional repressor